jgi:hypothetical protein
MHQWTDNNGVKHYSNSPPPESVTGYRTEPEIGPDKQHSRKRGGKGDETLQRDRENKAAEQRVEREQERAAQKTAEKKQLLESEKTLVEDDIVKKKRYLRGRSRRDLIKLEYIEKQLAELEKKGGNSEEIKHLEAEKQKVIELLIRHKRYFHRGGAQLLKEYEEIDQALKKY